MQFDVAIATCSVPVSCPLKMKIYHLRLNKAKYLVLSKTHVMCTLIFAFRGGVLKDRQALFSLQVLWNLILVAMLCKLETRPQL